MRYDLDRVSKCNLPEIAGPKHATEGVAHMRISAESILRAEEQKDEVEEGRFRSVKR